MLPLQEFRHPAEPFLFDRTNHLFVFRRILPRAGFGHVSSHRQAGSRDEENRSSRYQPIAPRRVSNGRHRQFSNYETKR
jgi:hypothetical protein